MTSGRKSATWHDIFVAIAVCLSFIVPGILKTGYSEYPLVQFLFAGWRLSVFWFFLFAVLITFERWLLNSHWYSSSWLRRPIGGNKYEG